MSKDITIDEYAKEVINELRAYSSDFDHAQVFKRIKNNGIKLTTIQPDLEETKIVPNIYVDYYFENNYTIDDAAKELFEQYQQSITSISNAETDGDALSIGINDVDNIMKFESAAPNIFVKLINTKQNTEFLKDVPSIPFGDLSITFAIMLSSKDGLASVNISNELLNSEDWKNHNVDTDMLLKYGINYMKHHTVINSMLDTMKELKEDAGDSSLDEVIKSMENGNNDPMIVFSTDTKTFGAGTMIVSDILQEIKNRLNGSYYILPSSIHELIALPMSQLSEMIAQNGDDAELNTAENYVSEKTVKALRDMISDVNHTQVPLKDILSYSLYYYDADADKLYYFEENDKQVEIDNLY